ncbi:hypothetical protein HA38_16515 [Pantoea allii]|nr:hypothetical protein HA38_16515 [Pantoea allii]PBJ99426.1 hypothetical protein CMR03_16100 [Pantoea allii]
MLRREEWILRSSFYASALLPGATDAVESVDAMDAEQHSQDVARAQGTRLKRRMFFIKDAW